MPDTPIESFIHLVQDTVEALKLQPKLAPPSAIQELEIFSSERLIPLCQQEQKSGRNPYVLSFVGLTNVGKSTLVEALLGFPVAPRKNGPATAIPVEYKHDSSWSFTIQHRASIRPSGCYPFADGQSLGRDLVRRVVDCDDAEAAEVAWVNVRGPMEILRHGLHMADTPGFGAAADENNGQSQQQRLEEFISKSVDRVYFCVAAGVAWAVSNIETQFYKKLSHLCGHVVVTKWEGTQDEQVDYRNRYQKLFPAAEFVFVNARRAMQGRGQSIELLEKLKGIITDYSTEERRRKICDQGLLAAWHDIKEHMESVHKLPHIPWRSDSLRQFLGSCDARPQLDPLSRDLKQTTLKPNP
ncbi:MAG: dynamin family protein [Verrucomicrobiota bacterium]